MTFLKSWRYVPLLALLGGSLGTMLSCSLSTPRDSASASSDSSRVYTLAHRTFLDALRDYFDVEPPTPPQPIAFTHQKHLANGIKCLDCHVGADKGPDAGIPSSKLCMTCHQIIDTDNPEIEKVASYFKKGQDIPWRRVYGFYPSAHVKFWHAPHVRAGVDCKNCHGDMRQQTVAVRSVHLTMGFCVDCHRLKKAPLDCTTCHF